MKVKMNMFVVVAMSLSIQSFAQAQLLLQAGVRGWTFNMTNSTEAEHQVSEPVVYRVSRKNVDPSKAENFNYRCSLFKASSSKAQLTGDASISRAALKMNDDYSLSASNEFGYSLNVSVQNLKTEEWVVYSETKLNIQEPELNPKEVTLASRHHQEVVVCSRMDTLL